MIRHILFDFDDTLSDFQLSKSLAKHKITPFLIKDKIDPDLYWKTFEDRFEATFRRYIDHELTVDEYRLMRFEHSGVGRKTATEFNNIYMDTVHTAILFSDVIPVFTELKSRGYHLYIFTNGPAFQRTKIVKTGIEPFVERIFISCEIGEGKPNRAAYDYVIKEINAPINEILMIGDNCEYDCVAAENAGIQAIQINRRNKAIDHYQYQISSLQELLDHLS